MGQPLILRLSPQADGVADGVGAADNGGASVGVAVRPLRSRRDPGRGPKTVRNHLRSVVTATTTREAKVKQALAVKSDADKLRRLDNRIKHWTIVLNGAQRALRVLHAQRDELLARRAVGR